MTVCIFYKFVIVLYGKEVIKSLPPSSLPLIYITIPDLKILDYIYIHFIFARKMSKT